MAACVATILDKQIEDVDVDVASCGNSVNALIAKIEEKAECKVYRLPHEAIVDATERYCIASVCSCVFQHDPSHPNSTWHSVVCEITEDGKLSLVFNPDQKDLRTSSLNQFAALGDLFVVIRGLRS
jgi:hypothetical protein